MKKTLFLFLISFLPALATDVPLNFNTSTGAITNIPAGIVINFGSGKLTVNGVVPVDLSSSQVLTNKTYNGLTVATSTGTLTIANGSTFATSGAFSTTITSTGATAITLPTSGTLATLAGTETLTNKSIAASEVNSGTLAIAQIPTGTSSSTVPLGSDNRFPASVTGLRKGAGSGSNDTAAVQADITALISGLYQPLNSNLTSWAAIARGTGFDAAAANAVNGASGFLATDSTGNPNLGIFQGLYPIGPATGNFAGIGDSQSATAGSPAGQDFVSYMGTMGFCSNNFYNGAMYNTGVVAINGAVGGSRAGTGTSTDILTPTTGQYITTITPKIPGTTGVPLWVSVETGNNDLTGSVGSFTPTTLSAFQASMSQIWASLRRDGATSVAYTIPAQSFGAYASANPGDPYYAARLTWNTWIRSQAHTVAVPVTGTSHTSTTIDGISSTAGITVGMVVTGSGVPSVTGSVATTSLTTVTVVGANSVTLSQATTSSTTGTFTFDNPGWDILYDIAAKPEFLNPSNRAYFRADALHRNPNGNRVSAQYVTALLCASITPTTYWNPLSSQSLPLSWLSSNGSINLNKTTTSPSVLVSSANASNLGTSIRVDGVSGSTSPGTIGFSYGGVDQWTLNTFGLVNVSSLAINDKIAGTIPFSIAEGTGVVTMLGGFVVGNGSTGGTVPTIFAATSANTDPDLILKSVNGGVTNYSNLQFDTHWKIRSLNNNEMDFTDLTNSVNQLQVFTGSGTTGSVAVAGSFTVGLNIFLLPLTSAMLKVNSSHQVVAAVSGTDYQTALPTATLYNQYLTSTFSNNATTAPAWTVLPVSSGGTSVFIPASGGTAFTTGGGPLQAASQAFDGTTNSGSNGWKISTVAGTLGYQFASAQVLTSYTIFPGGVGTGLTVAPKDWTFQGSNDGSSYTTLDTQTSQTTWTQGTGVSYTFTNTTPFLYYRLNITANNGSSATGLCELQFNSTIGTSSDMVVNSGNIIVVPGKGLVGGISSTLPSAGNVGYTVTNTVASGSAVSLTTATTANICDSGVLAAGHYLVSFQANVTSTTATMILSSPMQAGISTTSATLPSSDSIGSFPLALTVGSAVNSIPVAFQEVTLTGSGHIYGVENVTFSAGSEAGYGKLTVVQLP